MNHTLQNRKHNPLLGLLASATLLLLTACGRAPDNPPPPKPKAETPRGWDIPTDPQEKAAYDYAHSLKLPDSVPKSVPFDFQAAEKKAQEKGGKSVSDQYFEHLCKTEAGEYIFKTVENVEGVFQMRPRSAPGELDYDRYAPEEPTGLGYSHDVDRFGEFYLPSIYVQPMMGEYLFFERPSSATRVITRFKRELNNAPPEGSQNGVQTVVPGKYGWHFTLPFMVTKEDVSQRQAHYGYTWRGITRERDRELSIGSGEYLVVDLDTNEVLAVKRRFKISGHDKNRPSGVWWGNAQPCESEVVRQAGLTHHLKPIDQFVRRVLIPVRGVNNQYIPDNYRHTLQDEGN